MNSDPTFLLRQYDLVGSLSLEVARMGVLQSN